MAAFFSTSDDDHRAAAAAAAMSDGHLRPRDFYDEPAAVPRRTAYLNYPSALHLAMPAAVLQPFPPAGAPPSSRAGEADTDSPALNGETRPLSLSLGMRVPHPHFTYHPPPPPQAGSDVPFVVGSVSSSKYLTAARELLDEFVNVSEAMTRKPEKKKADDRDGGDGGSRSDTEPPVAAELSPSERQEVQNKVTALMNMLDEVDRRYRQYYHQMQLVAASFNVAAGADAAKPYTALALQTISRHFRSLRDAIGGQIQAGRRSLGELDAACAGAGMSRLRYIDQKMRQQRAMQQQFGASGGAAGQQQSWRPQRGLPESSVSVLRAWLFEHFLHPYPKDSEKMMLARQTGLSRGQVANWFINARVRLWKPMIEEMYREEFGDAEPVQSNSSSDHNHGRSGKDEIPSGSDDLNSSSPAKRSCAGGRLRCSEAAPAFQSSLPDSAGSASQFADFGLRHHDRGMNISNQHHHHRHHHQLAELGGYEGSSGSGVSLTLGLHHCNVTLPTMPNMPQSFLAVQGSSIYTAVTPGNADFECLATPESRQRFGPAQLLHDFVA